MDAKEVNELRRLLKKREAEVLAIRERCDKELEHIRQLLRLNSATDNIVPDKISSGRVLLVDENLFESIFPLDKIKGLKQEDAMIVVAKHYGGMLRTKDLIKHLQSAGLMSKTTKNAGSMTFRLITNSGRFERVATGLYRLLDENDPKRNPLFHANAQIQ